MWGLIGQMDYLARNIEVLQKCLPPKYRYLLSPVPLGLPREVANIRRLDSTRVESTRVDSLVHSCRVEFTIR